jgi:hypothetical protein
VEIKGRELERAGEQERAEERRELMALDNT